MLKKFVFSAFNDLGWSFEMRHEIRIWDKKFYSVIHYAMQFSD